jgi:hypothetical protein
VFTSAVTYAMPITRALNKFHELSTVEEEQLPARLGELQLSLGSSTFVPGVQLCGVLVSGWGGESCSTAPLEWPWSSTIRSSSEKCMTLSLSQE